MKGSRGADHEPNVDAEEETRDSVPCVSEEAGVGPSTGTRAGDDRRAEHLPDGGGIRYRQFVEDNHDGIVAVDADGFVFANDRFCELSGYERADLLSMDVADLVHEDDRDRIQSYADRRREGEPVPSRYRSRIVTAGGETRDLAVGVTTTVLDGTEAQLWTARDVTDRVRHERRLASFASVVSHDLRNPLNVISGRTDLARTTGDESHFEAIQRGVETLDDLLSRLRRLADHAVPVVDPEIVDLRAAAEAAWADVDADRTTLDLADDLGRVEADSARLELILAELFENAVVHGGSTVRLVATDDGFAVADDGPGIDAVDRDRVFEPAYTRHTDRTGFGLTIAEWTAEAHGWTVTLAEAEDGTRIEVAGVTRR